ncbi:MAG TPA: hypothetical protein VF598_10555 [Hymenobacter sp.]
MTKKLNIRKPSTKKLKSKELGTNMRINKGILVGASVAALAAGGIFLLTRNGWLPGIIEKSSKPTADTSADNTDAGATNEVDAALNDEVAGNITSNPSTEKEFTDEGATGNND